MPKRPGEFGKLLRHILPDEISHEDQIIPVAGRPPDPAGAVGPHNPPDVVGNVCRVVVQRDAVRQHVRRGQDAARPTGLGVVPRRVAERDQPLLRVDAGHSDEVAADAHPITTRLQLPEAEQQDHVLGAIDLLGDPVVAWSWHQGDLVLGGKAVIGQVFQDRLVHGDHIGAQLRDTAELPVGVHAPGQVLDELAVGAGRRAGIVHVAGIMVVPFAGHVGLDQRVVVVDGRGRHGRGLELAVEPPERIGDGDRATVGPTPVGGLRRGAHAPVILVLVEVGHAARRVIPPPAGLPEEGRDLGFVHQQRESQLK